MNFKKIIRNKIALMDFMVLAGVILLVGLFYPGRETDEFIGILHTLEVC